MQNLNHFQFNHTFNSDINNIGMYEYKKRILLCSNANTIVSCIKRHLNTLTIYDVPTFTDTIKAGFMADKARFPGILGPNTFYLYTTEFIDMSMNIEKEFIDYTTKLILSLMYIKDIKKFNKLKKEAINLYILHGGFFSFVEDIKSLEFRYKDI